MHTIEIQIKIEIEILQEIEQEEVIRINCVYNKIISTKTKQQLKMKI